MKKEFVPCRCCGQFVHHTDASCPFCDEAIEVPKQGPSRLKKVGVGIVAATALFGMSSLMGCAYGGPEQCGPNYCLGDEVCDQATRTCVKQPAPESNEQDAGGR